MDMNTSFEIHLRGDPSSIPLALLEPSGNLTFDLSPRCPGIAMVLGEEFAFPDYGFSFEISESTDLARIFDRVATVLRAIPNDALFVVNDSHENHTIEICRRVDGGVPTFRPLAANTPANFAAECATLRVRLDEQA